MNWRFRSCSFDQPYLLPPSLQDWLPENHLARFIAEIAHSPFDVSLVAYSWSLAAFLSFRQRPGCA
jgi:hypothetical protein